jgi:hypothetical protein
VRGTLDFFGLRVDPGEAAINGLAQNQVKTRAGTLTRNKPVEGDRLKLGILGSRVGDFFEECPTMLRAHDGSRTRR